jgi:hypothetical protein
VFPERGGIRFYRVLTARIHGVGRCTTQVELDHPAACCLLDALTGDMPGVVRVRHPSNGATTVTVALHGLAASLRVENAAQGVLHIVYDETQLPELIMHLEDGASWLPR